MEVAREDWVLLRERCVVNDITLVLITIAMIFAPRSPGDVWHRAWVQVDN
jgi:hypothetical protein